MQYKLEGGVLVEREHHADSWRPVPVQRLQEALEVVASQAPVRATVQHEGSLGVRVMRA